MLSDNKGIETKNIFISSIKNKTNYQTEQKLNLLDYENQNILKDKIIIPSENKISKNHAY